MRFLADENFNNDILRGLKSKNEEIDIMRVQDTEIYQAEDSIMLDWAAKEDRILLTHDVRTIPKYAYERIAAGLSMPGIIEVSRNISVGEALDELLILIGAGIPSDFANQVRYVPLR